MGVKSRQNSFDSPKVEVGEIDTRAPFSSVKAAVSLFGEGAFSGDRLIVRRAKPSTPEQRSLATETELHLAQKELNRFKEQLHSAETTRVQALAELEKARKTVDDLTHKLNTINESKEVALKATENAKTHSNQMKEEVSSGDQPGKLELDRSREQYATAITELDAAKQELRRIKKEFQESVEAKIAAFTQESESMQQSEVNADKAEELSQEIAAVQESLVHVKLAAEQAQQEEAKIRSEKDSTRKSYKLALEETEKKLTALKKDFNPQLHKDLESKIADTDAEITAIRKELENARASDLESVATVTTELDGAKEVLQKVAEEESSLRSLVESLKLELEAVKKEHNDLKEKDAETEALVGNLHIKLRKFKDELEAAMAAESKASLASSDLTSTLEQLSLESVSALQEAETMKKDAEDMRNEAESARTALAETEKKLEAALKEAEAAKAAETQALDEIKNLSARASAARSSTSGESGAAEITISREEFESFSRKVEESEKLTEMKVAAAVAQVEAVRASESEAAKRLEVVRKEIEDLEAATEEARKRAEMAEAAKRAVEGELRRWREKEQKKTAEAAARILAETEAEAAATGIETSPPKAKPQVAPAEGSSGRNRKMSRTAGASKKTLLPNLSGIFHRRKSQVDGGGSPNNKSV